MTRTLMPCRVRGATARLPRCSRQLCRQGGTSTYRCLPPRAIRIQHRCSVMQVQSVALVQVESAQGLRAADFSGLSDPFCIMSLGDFTVRTQVLLKTCGPCC